MNYLIRVKQLCNSGKFRIYKSTLRPAVIILYKKIKIKINNYYFSE